MNWNYDILKKFQKGISDIDLISYNKAILFLNKISEHRYLSRALYNPLDLESFYDKKIKFLEILVKITNFPLSEKEYKELEDINVIMIKDGNILKIFFHIDDIDTLINKFNNIQKSNKTIKKYNL